MTTQEIDKRIKILSKEVEILAASHQATVNNYQATITNNQNRYQPIQGALKELEWVKAQLNGAQQ